MVNGTIIDILRGMRNESHVHPTPNPYIIETTGNVDKIISPILYVIGFPGNILSFIVWQQPRMRHSSGHYLAVLAVADLLFLLLHVLLELHKIWGVHVLDAPVVCEGLPLVYTALQYLSPLLVLGFTVERFISVCFPMKRHIYCTTRRAQIVTAGLALFSLLLGAMQGYFYTYNSSYQACMFRAAVGQGGHQSLWAIWTWITELLVFLCVPLFILIFNLIILKVVKEAKNLVELETGGKVHVQTTTFTLLLVSFFVIITSFPVSVVYCIQYQFIPASEFGPSLNGFHKYLLAKTIVEEIGIIHFACKFYIFLVAERLFRDEFLCLVRRVIFRSTDTVGYTPQTEHTIQSEWNDTEMVPSAYPDETNI